MEALCSYMSIQILFGQNVRLAREKKSWSQDRLSEESGLHRTYISGIERGVRNPTIEIVQQIAIALDVDLPDLFVSPNLKS
jgi:transcriptional regulator with XRE-family HTH domain